MNKQYINMAKLVFNYGAMNAGKSLTLLAFAAKLRNKGIPYKVIKPSTDTRDGAFISSRPLQEKLPCELWQDNHFFEEEHLKQFKYILVDEAQFLSELQVDHLTYIVDKLNINVVCYGLRTDFQTHLFAGSKRLFEMADELREIEDIDAEGNKVIINARIKDGKVVIAGPQVEVGAEDKYQSMSRKEFYDKIDVTASMWELVEEENKKHQSKYNKELIDKIDAVLNDAEDAEENKIAEEISKLKFNGNEVVSEKPQKRQIRCKTEDCEGQSCRTCTHRTVDALIESEEMYGVFSEKQIQMLDGLFHIHTREFADTIEKWIKSEIMPAIKDWTRDEIYAIVEDKLEKFKDVMQDWVTEDYSPEVQKWLTSEFADKIEKWIYEEALPNFLSKLKFPKSNELIEETE